jgi:hypothetical protein
MIGAVAGFDPRVRMAPVVAGAPVGARSGTTGVEAVSSKKSSIQNVGEHPDAPGEGGGIGTTRAFDLAGSNRFGRVISMISNRSGLRTVSFMTVRELSQARTHSPA